MITPNSPQGHGVWLTALVITIAPTGGSAPCAGQDDVADVDAKAFQVGDNARMKSTLVGRAGEGLAPEDGYQFLIVIAGGDGGEDFLPFTKRIYKNALSDEYLVARLLPVEWASGQAARIVLPTKKPRAPQMGFSTEEQVDAVVADVGSRTKLNPNHVFVMGWSSGGPPSYAAALSKPTSVTGAYVAMSSFVPAKLPPIGNAAARGFYIQHSPQDGICPIRMAENARDRLFDAGVKVECARHEGGHGWRGDLYGKIRKAIAWPEEQTAD